MFVRFLSFGLVCSILLLMFWLSLLGFFYVLKLLVVLMWVILLFIFWIILWRNLMVIGWLLWFERVCSEFYWWLMI